MSAPIYERVEAYKRAVELWDHPLLFTPEEFRTILEQNAAALKAIERAKVLRTALLGIIECYMSTDQPAELFALIEKAREEIK